MLHYAALRLVIVGVLLLSRHTSVAGTLRFREVSWLLLALSSSSSVLPLLNLRRPSSPALTLMVDSPPVVIGLTQLLTSLQLSTT